VTRPTHYEFIAVFVEGSDHWIVGYIEEPPGVFSQGGRFEKPSMPVQAANLTNRKRTAEDLRSRGVPAIRGDKPVL
jgi:hypothetical protein